ncbi:CBL-interacting protein kinase 33 [Wickerhamomyces ciferrii]|uniref:CBL-interacting protein kinase 33 n=1 Tax=Wickerhamomyces ciferrii (strain ATCC 14091 / BCRC 22168 / CBS 111 / JCM 3599 / NBRC 0793 / NRRL Y-1031 F-60-10) TaxID=1206466 RepID=K0K898_WICCF|nr:CBL-interacting protein kinase 33 [Wickerhamomyces ciferrii]CCH41055.1 CBL-interacting protein kinase 33 [Wickerhamomyces ciferrii]
MTIPKHNINGAILNDYEILKEIGSGAYGIVYKARHLITGQEVAIKSISKVINSSNNSNKKLKQSEILLSELFNYFKNLDFKATGLNTLNLKLLSEFNSSNAKCCSFIKEITIHLKVHDHPNVITIHKIIDSPIALFIIMDYFPEGDLFVNIVDNAKYTSDPMLIKKVFIQLIDVISYCHSKKIYHCDIKPENIMCSQNGSNLYIGDFGLAMESELINAKTCIGSSYYMPPERLISSNKSQTSTTTQTAGSKCPFNHGNPPPSELTAKSYPAQAGDLWSLAIILINLTCTRNPWMKASELDNTYRAFCSKPEILKEILPISDELYKILLLCLERNPFNRITLFQLRELIIQCESFTTEGPLSYCDGSLNEFMDCKVLKTRTPTPTSTIVQTSTSPLISDLEEYKELLKLKQLIPENHIPLNFNKDDQGIHVELVHTNQQENWIEDLNLIDDNYSILTNVSFNLNCDLIEAGGDFYLNM